MSIKDLKKKDPVNGFFILKDIEERISTKTDQPFLTLTLLDKETEIVGKMWNSSLAEYPYLKPSNLVYIIDSTVDFYKDSPQLNITKIRGTNESDEKSIEDFAPCAPYSGIEMFSYISETVNDFKNEELKLLVNTILKQKEDFLLFFPAAKDVHHDVRHGLLWHTTTMLKIAKNLKDLYPEINEELLFTGIILHDIAKIDEYEVSNIGLVTDTTISGILLGHLVKGAMYVAQIGKELGIQERTLELVEHMLISHHGKLEYGAAVKPAFVEAEILSRLDMLDSRVNIFLKETNKLNPGMHSGYISYLDGAKIVNINENEEE